MEWCIWLSMVSDLQTQITNNNLRIVVLILRLSLGASNSSSSASSWNSTWTLLDIIHIQWSLYTTETTQEAPSTFTKQLQQMTQNLRNSPLIYRVWHMNKLYCVESWIITSTQIWTTGRQYFPISADNLDTSVNLSIVEEEAAVPPWYPGA